MIIQLKEQGRDLQILTKDNGFGFNYSKILVESDGIGLRNIQNRVEIMGGKMQIESSSVNGTKYFIKIPIV